MLPQIGSGAVTRAAPDGSGDSVDLGKLLGETLARLISEKRKARAEATLSYVMHALPRGRGLRQC